ncbi:hypothetical protein BY996DRAFT_7898800 [Phakopsora pachyrhizi]|uniref:Expressed protein n=1 Tax=Phakopsora pachyrhizi TaxID=170000 RepID=A0AAV0B583_PHAPC|nr:hypothetical protein BY996DRAFT_7898800 [Phakopsora pachyrhizi]CAH7681978.1 expressed protein [Phakopsora pachyrhizi]
MTQKGSSKLTASIETNPKPEFSTSSSTFKNDHYVNPRPTKTVRHRLPLRKVNEVWKPLSSNSCQMLQNSLSEAILKSNLNSQQSSQSFERIDELSKALMSQMRVPVGVFTGLNSNKEGQVELISLESLKEKNKSLAAMIEKREKNFSKLSDKSHN